MNPRDIEKKKFLIVDDFGEMRSMLRGLLGLLNITSIDMVANGEDAIKKLESNKYDVILCDYNLGPGKDGQQVLEEARHRRLIGLNTLFLMITAENTRDMVMGVIEYAPDTYLSKPFSKDLLLTRVSKLFEKRADFAKIDQALVKEDYLLALTMIDKQMQQSPKHLPELTRLKADTLYHAAKYNEAEHIYDDILAERDLPWAKMGLGKVYVGQKRHEEAQELFGNVISNNPNLTSAYDWLSKCQQHLKKRTEAQQTLQKAVEISPKNIIRQQQLGTLCIQNKDYTRAEQAFTMAVDYGKNSVYNHPALYADLAKTKSQLNKHGDAYEVIEKIGKTFKDDQTAQLYAGAAEAVVHQNQGDKEAAAACMEKAEALRGLPGTSNDTSVILELAKANAYLGENEKAEKLLKQVVRDNHDNEALLSEISEVYRETALTEDPDGLVKEIRKEVVLMNNKGVKLLKDGEFDSAITLFEQAAENMSGNKNINLNAARAWIMKMEKSGKAEVSGLSKIRKYIDRVQLIDPNDPGLLQVMKRWQRLGNL